MSYQIFDDLFPESLVNDIEATLTNFKFDWHYTDASSGGTVPFYRDPLSKDCPQMVHMFYRYGWESQYSEVVKPLLEIVEKETETTIKSIYRIKANLTIPDGTSNKHYNTPHRDHESKEFLSMVYYVQDTDGDTVLFDKHDITDETLDIVARVTPSRGRCVIFPSRQYHSSSNPIMFESRIILNFIFEI